tara:strand:- start:318 stop:509 length:192 start_codon:yes stop_codon:yes gene_type:complete
MTKQEELNQQKAGLLDDLMATATVKEELWRYHPDNPNKKDLIKEYDVLCVIEKNIEVELDSLN